jgi:hypothetical protein
MFVRADSSVLFPPLSFFHVRAAASLSHAHAVGVGLSHYSFDIAISRNMNQPNFPPIVPFLPNTFPVPSASRTLFLLLAPPLVDASS